MGMHFVFLVTIFMIECTVHASACQGMQAIVVDLVTVLKYIYVDTYTHVCAYNLFMAEIQAVSTTKIFSCLCLSLSTLSLSLFLSLIVRSI